MLSIFLYCGGFDHPAYFIIPKDCYKFRKYEEDVYRIQHQYNCVCCDQFYIEGQVEPINDPALAEAFISTLGTCNPNKLLIEMQTGLKVRSVLGEGLCELEDGRYVAVNNCD